MAVRYRLSQAKLASETKNQLIEHIDLRTPSKFQVLTPKTEVASSNGQTGSYSGRECILFRFKAVCEDEMGASGRSFALLPWLGISWVQIAHGACLRVRSTADIPFPLPTPL